MIKVLAAGGAIIIAAIGYGLANDTSPAPQQCSASVANVHTGQLGHNWVLDFHMVTVGCPRSAGRFDYDVTIRDLGTGNESKIARATSWVPHESNGNEFSIRDRPGTVDARRLAIIAVDVEEPVSCWCE